MSFDERRPNRYLTPEQWTELRGRYERGEAPAALGRAYGIARSSISKRAKREGWLACGALKEQAVREAQAEVKQTIKADYKKQALAANDRHLKVYRAIQGMAAQLLRQLDANLNEADPDKRRRVTDECHSLASLTAMVKTAIEGERAVMQLDKMNLNDEQEDGFDRLCIVIAQKRTERNAGQ